MSRLEEIKAAKAIHDAGQKGPWWVRTEDMAYMVKRLDRAEEIIRVIEEATGPWEMIEKYRAEGENG